MIVVDLITTNNIKNEYVHFPVLVSKERWTDGHYIRVLPNINKKTCHILHKEH